MAKKNTVDVVFLIAILAVLVGLFIYVNTLPPEPEEPTAEDVANDFSDKYDGKYGKFEIAGEESGRDTVPVEPDDMVKVVDEKTDSTIIFGIYEEEDVAAEEYEAAWEEIEKMEDATVDAIDIDGYDDIVAGIVTLGSEEYAIPHLVFIAVGETMMFAGDVTCDDEFTDEDVAELLNVCLETIGI